MRHGFRAQAERRAADVRIALGLKPNAPFDPWAYAVHLNVAVLEFGTLDLSAHAVRQLTVKDRDSWSAMTLRDGSSFAVVVNPVHAEEDQRGYLVHELAHIELRHLPARVEVSETELLLLCDYSDEQDQEADWFGGTLFLPRDGLLRLHARRKSTAQIAQYYGVSEALCEARLRLARIAVQGRRSYPR